MKSHLSHENQTANGKIGKHDQAMGSLRRF